MSKRGRERHAEVCRHRAKDESPKRSMAMSRHHDQIDFFCCCVANDLVSGIADPHQTSDIDSVKFRCEKAIEHLL